MKYNVEQYLPIGTIVLLKNATKKLMITGFGVKGTENKNKIYDYSGCIYPEGIFETSDAQLVLFDDSQIDKIYYEGLSDDDEEREFKKKLNKIANADTEN